MPSAIEITPTVRMSPCLGLQGNVILTDANYEILTLLRSHRDDNKGISFMARHAYPIHSIRLQTPLETGQLRSALESADDKQTLRGGLLLPVLPFRRTAQHNASDSSSSLFVYTRGPGSLLRDLTGGCVLRLGLEEGMLAAHFPPCFWQADSSNHC